MTFLRFKQPKSYHMLRRNPQGAPSVHPDFEETLARKLPDHARQFQLEKNGNDLRGRAPLNGLDEMVECNRRVGLESREHCPGRSTA